MTKNQVIKRIRSEKREMNNWIEKESKRLLDSGAIDCKSYANDFQLPGIILTVALKNMIAQYSPCSSESKKEIENLNHF
jgi:hypothetical protein